jgi:hypothetical protein
MPKRKHVKKNKLVPCTDTNQHRREHNEMIKKKNDYIIRKMAEIKAKQMMERQAATNDTSSQTIAPPVGSDTI